MQSKCTAQDEMHALTNTSGYRLPHGSETLVTMHDMKAIETCHERQPSKRADLIPQSSATLFLLKNLFWTIRQRIQAPFNARIVRACALKAAACRLSPLKLLKVGTRH